jgi:hypothetical protein
MHTHAHIHARARTFRARRIFRCATARAVVVTWQSIPKQRQAQNATPSTTCSGEYNMQWRFKPHARCTRQRCIVACGRLHRCILRVASLDLATCEPMKPAAPVTSTRVSGCHDNTSAISEKYAHMHMRMRMRMHMHTRMHAHVYTPHARTRTNHGSRRAKAAPRWCVNWNDNESGSGGVGGRERGSESTCGGMYNGLVYRVQASARGACDQTEWSQHCALRVEPGTGPSSWSGSTAGRTQTGQWRRPSTPAPSCRETAVADYAALAVRCPPSLHRITRN